MHPINGDVGSSYMHRTQADALGDSYSRLCVLDCSGHPDVVRQEMRDETDINVLVSRFGVDVPQRRVEFGARDMQLDLLSGLQALERVDDAYARQPEAVREKYRSVSAWLAALRDGSAYAEVPADVPVDPPAPVAEGGSAGSAG